MDTQPGARLLAREAPPSYQKAPYQQSLSTDTARVIRVRAPTRLCMTMRHALAPKISQQLLETLQHFTHLFFRIGPACAFEQKVTVLNGRLSSRDSRGDAHGVLSWGSRCRDRRK
jgi:hypothetical protein